MSQAGRQYFSELEKSTLLMLVDKHKKVLENKRNDFKVIKEKNQTWESLSEEFNSQRGVKKRDSKQLKKCWENIKARAKKSIAKEKREAKLTGLSNSFNSDNIVKDEQDFFVVDHDINQYDVDVSSTPATFATNNPNEVPSSKSEVVSKDQLTPTQASCLAMQQEQHQAELQYVKKKMEYLEEEHKRKMEVLDAELRYWQKMCDSKISKKASLIFE